MLRTVLAIAAVFVVGVFDKPSKPFTSKEGGFTIGLPGDPVVDKSEMATPYGPMSATTFSITSKEGLLQVLVAEVPAGRSKATPAELLDGAAAGAFKILNVPAEKTTKIKLGANPGLESRGHDDQIDAVVRDYLVHGRVYQILVMTARGAMKAAEVKKFFGSFKVL